KAGVDAFEGWEPIGNDTVKFTGIFNGNGNKITNLWINRTSTNYVGLFGYIENAQIKNLGVEAEEVKGYYYVGVIAGFVYEGAITNNYATGSVSATGNCVGGIVGYVSSNSTIKNSYAAGNVSGTGSSIGGIAGYIGESEIKNSYTTVDVSGTGSDIGGIAGYVYDAATIKNSYAAGDVSGINGVGGIAGTVYDSDVKNNAVVNPSVSGNSHTHRVVGRTNNLFHVSDNLALTSMMITPSSSDADLNGANATDTELKTKATYEGLGWSFTDVWIMPAGGGYPILQWQQP
ncbi:MAG: hypothetical protein LBF86_02330, partial [Helicobacteraceae bacterium]|nr:hypothetical protein [Helicobacteraceae bacterium]